MKRAVPAYKLCVYLRYSAHLILNSRLYGALLLFF